MRQENRKIFRWTLTGPCWFGIIQNVKHTLHFGDADMKQILKKLGFRFPDEMEKAIRFKAQRNAYLFLVISLLIWSLYESYKVYTAHSRLNLFPCLLLVTAAGIQTLSQCIMTHNAVKGNEDSHETGPLIKIVLLICVIAGVIAAAAASIILLSVKL